MQVERAATSRGHRVWPAPRASVLALACLTLAAVMPASAATLERIRESGHIRLGYLADARPFTSGAEGGAPEGYAVTLCQGIADRVKAHLALPQLTVDWVPVTTDSRLREVQQGNVDLLCAPMAVTLTRRQDVSFSIPVFPAGVRAVVRADAPAALRDALAESPTTRPVWRGSPAAKVLEKTSFAVVSGTTSEKLLADRLVKFQVDARAVPVPDYRTGLQQLLDRKVDVFFGDRSVVLGAIDDASRKDILILDRMLTQEPAAFALARGDEDFRLLVDTALSELYASADFRDVYTKWFGALDEGTRAFFLWNAVQQ